MNCIFKTDNYLNCKLSLICDFVQLGFAGSKISSQFAIPTSYSVDRNRQAVVIVATIN
jgi:hypothetical protein